MCSPALLRGHTPSEHRGTVVDAERYDVIAHRFASAERSALQIARSGSRTRASSSEGACTVSRMRARDSPGIRSWRN